MTQISEPEQWEVDRVWHTDLAWSKKLKSWGKTFFDTNLIVLVEF